ncbi:MFS transporter [Arthrobacter sp. 35W]|uniref:MFS transporter n=1 Tax=Arthrobacter sp. 35W TaxID=1132441 RepID=UPI000427CE91|nr:MFS transporter [Arthrobacter sp. 35W]
MVQPPAVSRQRSTSPRSIVTILAFIGIVVSLMQTLVIPILPQLPVLLHATATDTSWIITATLLAGAVVTPISGRLGDMFGKRRMLIISLALLTLGSILCAVTSSLPVMLAGRILQGLAAGAIPLGISILRDELPREKVGSAVATMSATMGVGGAIGLPVAALIAQNADWHVLFWTSAGMGVLALALVALVLPESPVRTPAKFDGVGAAGLMVGLVALLLPITKGADWGWNSPLTLGLFAAAAVVLVLWGVFELRVASPLVDLRVSARPRVLFTNLASISVGFAMYAMNLAFPQLLMSPSATGYGLGQTMVQAGLALAPGGLVMMLVSPVSARLTTRRGPKVTLMLGAAVIGAGYLLAFLLTAEVWQVIAASMVIGAGIGLAYAAMPALIMGAVPLTETAAANGLNSLMRAFGTASSAAVMGVVLANMTMPLGPVQVPTMAGFHTTFAIGAIAAVAAVVLAAFIPARDTTPGAGAPSKDAPQLQDA